MFYFTLENFSLIWRHRRRATIFSSLKLKAQSPVVCHLSFPLSVCPLVRLKTFHIFNFFSRTTGPISTKFGTKNPWVEGIQVYPNEGPHPSTRGDNSIFKNHFLQNSWANFYQFSRTTGLISSKLGTKYPWMKGIQVYLTFLQWKRFKFVQMMSHCPSQRGDKS